MCVWALTDIAKVLTVRYEHNKCQNTINLGRNLFLSKNIIYVHLLSIDIFHILKVKQSRYRPGVAERVPGS
jgi:hypothetical protein